MPVHPKMSFKAIVKYDDGKQWDYILEDIKYGDLFTLTKEEDYFHYVLDRRMALYIIKKWNNTKIPEVQEMIATYKSGM